MTCSDASSPTTPRSPEPSRTTTASRNRTHNPQAIASGQQPSRTLNRQPRRTAEAGCVQTFSTSSRRPADAGRARHGRPPGPLSAPPPRAGQRPGRAETRSGSPEARRKPDAPARRTPGRRRGDSSELAGTEVGPVGSVGFTHLPGPGPASGKARGPLVQIPGRITTCPSCRASVRPPDHARPQPGQDTGQSPLRRPHARSRLTATPTATRAHHRALPRTPTDRPKFADQRKCRQRPPGEHTYYVVAGATPVLVHNCGEADDDLLDFADEALSMSPESRPNVATKITSAYGEHVRFSYATDTRSGAMPPQTARAVANSGHHGGCGEVGCAIQFESAGIPLEGATFQSVRIGGGGRGNSFPIEDQGELIAPCPACQRFLPQIGGRG